MIFAMALAATKRAMANIYHLCRPRYPNICLIARLVFFGRLKFAILAITDSLLPAVNNRFPDKWSCVSKAPHGFRTRPAGRPPG